MITYSKLYYGVHMAGLLKNAGLAGALTAVLFASDAAKPADSEAYGRRGYSVSVSACIGNCFGYVPFVPVRYVYPAVVRVPYSNGVYYVQQPAYAVPPAPAAPAAPSQEGQTFREQLAKERELGRLETENRFLREQLARTQLSSQAPASPAPTAPQPPAAPALPAPAATSAPALPAPTAPPPAARTPLDVYTVLGILFEEFNNRDPNYVHGQQGKPVMFKSKTAEITTCPLDFILKKGGTPNIYTLVTRPPTEECDAKNRRVVEEVNRYAKAEYRPLPIFHSPDDVRNWANEVDKRPQKSKIFQFRK